MLEEPACVAVSSGKAPPHGIHARDRASGSPGALEGTGSVDGLRPVGWFEGSFRPLLGWVLLWEERVYSQRCKYITNRAANAHPIGYDIAREYSLYLAILSLWALTLRIQIDIFLVHGLYSEEKKNLGMYHVGSLP